MNKLSFAIFIALIDIFNLAIPARVAAFPVEAGYPPLTTPNSARADVVPRDGPVPGYCPFGAHVWQQCGAVARVGTYVWEKGTYISIPKFRDSSKRVIDGPAFIATTLGTQTATTELLGGKFQARYQAGKDNLERKSSLPSRTVGLITTRRLSSAVFACGPHGSKTSRVTWTVQNFRQIPLKGEHYSYLSFICLPNSCVGSAHDMLVQILEAQPAGTLKTRPSDCLV
jgi:hypothetical protein